MIRETALRSRWRLLVAGAIFLAANLAWLISFQVLYVRRVEGRTAEMAKNDGVISQLRSELAGARAGLERFRNLGVDRKAFLEDVLGDEDSKLTGRIRRLWELARTSGLRVSSVNFKADELTKAPVRVYEMSFSTDSTYAQLKAFLNALELDEEFLAVTQLGLGKNDPQSGRSELALGMTVVTAFHDPAIVTGTSRGARPIPKPGGTAR